MEQIETLDVIELQEQPVEQQLDFIPKTFDDYLGQKELKEKLSIYTQAAKLRGEPLDHLLLFGPPGLGKTTLSQIMAHVMNVGIKICSGPTMERTGDLVAILSGLEPNDILFIDEIHRLPKNVEEMLYSAMEQFRVDIIIGQGTGAQSVNLPINPFTLVGATTKSGMIAAPLRSRFGIIEQLDFYNIDDLAHIILQNAQYLQLQLSQESALQLAQCSRGTPRIAKKLLRRIRDFAQIKNKNIADETLVANSLECLGIDKNGLSTFDNKLLSLIINNFNGGPVGLETLASLTGQDKETIETVYEPFLLRSGYLEKTPRGRQIPRIQLTKLREKSTGQKTIL